MSGRRLSEQGVVDLYHCWPDDDDEHRWEDAQYQGNEHLYRRLLGRFLDSLPVCRANLFGLDP